MATGAGLRVLRNSSIEHSGSVLGSNVWYWKRSSIFKKVTSVMFGGPNLDILFVTSMAKPPLPRFPSDGILRGSLFAVYNLGVRGVPEPRFAG